MPDYVVTLLMYGGIIVALYFIMIHPQKKREKALSNMRNNLKSGDTVITISGIHGKVVRIKDETITIEINADKTQMKIEKWAIQKVQELITE